MSKRSLYRITFSNQEILYEIYARKICESELFGFLEVEDFVFGETTALLVDPSEERLKLEFQDIKRTYIPMHAIIRIDEVIKQGVAKVYDKDGSQNKVSIFPKTNKRTD